METLVAQSPDAIVDVDADSLITSWNHAAEQIYGFTAAEALGHEGADRIYPDASSGDETRHFETKQAHKDGRTLTLSVAESPVRDTTGRITGAVSTIRDISDTQEFKDDIERAAVREARLLGVAHDFNNLLGIIVSYASLVEEALAPDSQALEDLGQIRGAAERGAALTRQLLLFSRGDVVDRERIDVNELVAELNLLLHRSLGERVALEIKLGRDVRAVEADRGQLEQVLVNLVVNGRDAMPDGGRLIIETGNASIGSDDAHGTLAAGEYVRLTVSDTGGGMDDETLQHAFDPLFTTKASGEGTGLGLATVHGIVADAGGQITLRSEPGVGTSVRILLPAVAVSPRSEVSRDQATGRCLSHAPPPHRTP